MPNDCASKVLEVAITPETDWCLSHGLSDHKP